MTIKELTRVLAELQNPLDSSYNKQILAQYEGLGFVEFNEQIGLPKNNGVELDMFDYELDFVDRLENKTNYLWIKSRGLGITECKALMSDNLVAIDESFDKLLVACHTAQIRRGYFTSSKCPTVTHSILCCYQCEGLNLHNV